MRLRWQRGQYQPVCSPILYPACDRWYPSASKIIFTLGEQTAPNMTSFLKSVALVVTSHRGVRAGPSVATFVETVLESATKAGNVNLKTVDVKTFNLPVFGESLVPKMMAMQGIEFEDEAPKAWAKEIASHDGYLFLVNEYNGGSTSFIDESDNSCLPFPVPNGSERS